MSLNHFLHADFETFSLVDLTVVGLDNYARHPSTGVSILGWSIDDEPKINAWIPILPFSQHPAIGQLPKRLLEAILDPDVIIVTWNAPFEHAIFNYVLKIEIPISRFRDPTVLAHNLSLPGKLEKVAIILKMAEQKDPRGDELKKMFCQPVSMGGETTLFGVTTPLFRDHKSHPKEFAEYIEYCFDPSHTLLGDDLVWRPADSFREGDTVLGFDENGPNRKFKRAVIEKISYAEEECFDVELESGKHFVVTGGHRWLVSKYRGKPGNSQSLHWVATKKLLHRHARKDSTCSRIPKIAPIWETQSSFDAGWLSGIFDGEANLGYQAKQRTLNTIRIAQNPGEVLEKIKNGLTQFGFEWTESDHKRCKSVTLTGGKLELLRFLGSIRPARLMEKVNFDMMGRVECRYGSETITRVTPAGVRKIIRIQTSTGTLVVDGYPMHNCKQDVRAERALWHRLSKIGFPEHEWQGWLLNHKINEYGIPVRRDLAEKGLRLAQRYIKEQRDICKTLTGLENPNSDAQMKAWARERGYTLNSLLAGTVATELKNPASTVTAECRTALLARGKARKSSWTKIESLLTILSEDDRLRYQFRYMGAARTGRWASGGGEDASVQVQNMARGVKAVKKKLDLALRLLDAEDYDGIIREFTNTPNPDDSITVVDFVITLLRSLFQAKPGKKFIVADKNAIENRMLGWAAGCKRILDVFREGRCPYMDFGALLFSIPYEQWYKVDELGNHKPKNAEFEEKRQQSKPPVLGGGYCLGGGELYIDENGDEKRGGVWGYALNVCGVDMPKELAHKAIKILRDAWPEVVVFWSDLEEAFKQVFKRGGVVKVGEVTWNKQQRGWVEHPTKGKGCVITFRRIKMEDGGYTIRAELPSGRALHYLNVSIEEEEKVSQKTGNPYTSQTIYYDGIEHSSTQAADGSRAKKQHKWGRVKTYGGKLCENFIQAMSRDDLLNSMFLADEMGFSLWGLFHDELAAEADDVWDGLTLADLNWCMTQVPSWAPGLMLGAEGYESKVYKKG